jgi:hypothetical protein
MKSPLNHNMWDAAKAVIRGKYSNDCLKKPERSLINNIMMHLRLLEKQSNAKIVKGK